MKAPFALGGRVRLGQLAGMYPEGMSLDNYRRLQRLIKTHGSAAMVGLAFSHPSDDEHERLTAFLKAIESGAIKASAW